MSGAEDMEIAPEVMGKIRKEMVLSWARARSFARASRWHELWCEVEAASGLLVIHRCLYGNIEIVPNPDIFGITRHVPIRVPRMIPVGELFRD